MVTATGVDAEAHGSAPERAGEVRMSSVAFMRPSDGTVDQSSRFEIPRSELVKLAWARRTMLSEAMPSGVAG